MIIMNATNHLPIKRTYASSTGIGPTILLVVLQLGLLGAEQQKKTSGFNAQWLKAVVSVEQLQSPTNASPLGTGFLLASPNKHVVLVTAKHIIVHTDGSVRKNLAFRLNNRTNQSDLLSDVAATSLVGAWVVSSNADLAWIPHEAVGVFSIRLANMAKDKQEEVNGQAFFAADVLLRMQFIGKVDPQLHAGDIIRPQGPIQGQLGVAD